MEYDGENRLQNADTFCACAFFYQIFLNYDKAGLSSSENTDMRLPDVYIKVKSSYYRAHV